MLITMITYDYLHYVRVIHIAEVKWSIIICYDVIN